MKFLQKALLAPKIGLPTYLVLSSFLGCVSNIKKERKKGRQTDRLFKSTERVLILWKSNPDFLKKCLLNTLSNQLVCVSVAMHHECVRHYFSH